MILYRIDNGDGVLREATREEWAAWFDTPARFVEHTKTPDGTIVSTICLGHKGIGGWYETCIFSNGDSEVVERYATRAEAVEGHERWERHALSGGAQ